MTGGGWPECHVCGRRCVCGQTDAHGRPTHLGCQAQMPVEARTPKLAEHPTRHRIPPARKEPTREQQAPETVECH
jgi:hypothetical protein